MRDHFLDLPLPPTINSLFGTSSSPLYPLLSDELVFAPGVVELSILLGVHEDAEAEAHEQFDLFLYEPWGGARLGSQHRTRVTINDAETGGAATTHHSRSALHYDDPGDGGDVYDDGSEEMGPAASARGDVVIAGTAKSATLVARNALGGLRGFGGDAFEARVEVRGAAEEGNLYGDVSFVDGTEASSYSASAAGAASAAAAAAAAITRVEDLGSGNYTISYQVSVVQAEPYSLSTVPQNNIVVIQVKTIFGSFLSILPRMFGKTMREKRVDLRNWFAAKATPKTFEWNTF